MDFGDLKELQLGRPSCSFQITLKLGVVHHLLKVFSCVPHIDFDHAIVSWRTVVRYAPRLLAGNGMLKLCIVGGKELVRVSFPPEQNEYGHYTLLAGLLGYVCQLLITTTGKLPSEKV
jgi:hypothetical protein